MFKGKEQVDMVQVNRQSAYLFGRDRVVSPHQRMLPHEAPAIVMQADALYLTPAGSRHPVGSPFGIEAACSAPVQTGSGEERIRRDQDVDKVSGTAYERGMELVAYAATTVRPYIIDLDSANGTSVNDEKIPASRYYELKPSDVLKFAFSTRECELHLPDCTGIHLTQVHTARQML